MGNFSAAMLAESRKIGANLSPFVDITWAGTSVGRYSITDQLGYEGRVTNVGDVQLFSFSPTTSDLAPQDVDVELADSDAAITKLLCGAYSQHKAAIVLRQGGPDLDSDDWWTFFTGIIRDWSIKNDRVVLHCTTDARAIESATPDIAIRIASAPADSRGIYWPEAYGVHNSSSLTSAGMIQAVCYARDATSGYRYCPTRGIAKSVTRVHKNDTLQTVSTDYTITYPVIGGIQITSIDFVSATTASDKITCDLSGFTDDGTTAGNTLVSPVAQIKDWLSTFLLGGTARLGLPSMAVAASALYGYGAVGAFVVGGEANQEQGLARFNAWLRCWPMLRSGWDSEGKIGLYVFSVIHPLEYSDWPWYDGWAEGEDQDLERSFAPESSGASTAKTIDVSYVYGTADGKYWATLSVQDLSVDDEFVEQLQMSHGPAEF